MKMTKTWCVRLGVVLVVAWSWLGWGGASQALAVPPEPGDISVTAEDSGGGVDLNPGQILEITLDGSPATGYGWDLKSVDDRILRQIGPAEFKPTVPPILGRFPVLGAAGKVTLRFAAAQAGTTDLQLVQRRSWQAATSAKRSFSLQVRAQGDYEGLRSLPDVPDVTTESAPRLEIGPTHVLGLPASYNWCDQGGCTPVRDQGGCGSCWAFGTVGPLESALRIVDGVERDLSEQYLVSCNASGWSCSGGWWAHDYHRDVVPAGEAGAGARNEADFPYQATDASCNPPHAPREQLEGWTYVGTSYGVPSVASIKQAIYDHGPVAAAVCVGGSFSGYSNGVFATNETCTDTVNHAIVLVGWNDAEQAWYLRNSWGTGWGESGYMRIKWGTSNVGYAANFVSYGGSGPGPATPTGLTATAVGVTQIDLSWTDNSSDEDGFKIAWSGDDGSTWSQIATVAANATSYSDTGGPFVCGSTHLYRVRAFGAAGDSAYSNTAGANINDCDGCRDDYEPDNAAAEAVALSVNSPAQAHNLHQPGDQDWAWVSLTAGRVYTLATSNLGVSNDTYLYLYDRDGRTLLASDDDSGAGLASQLVWTPSTSGDYYLMTRHYFGNVGGCTDFEYDLVAAAVLVPPSNLVATDGTFTDRVRISWGAVDGAKSYNVYWATAATGAKTLLGSTANTQLDHTTGTVGATYYYWVTACAGSQCSGFGAYDAGWRAAVLPPTGVQASDGTYTDRVRVSWTAVSGATSYQVYGATTITGTRTSLGSTTGTYLNHRAATAGRVYYYWVKVCQSALCSNYSSPDSGWRNLTPPTNVQATDGTLTDRVRITWVAVSGAQSYQVFWSTAATGTRTLLISATTTTADHLSATRAVTYYYWVAACASPGCSDYGVYNSGWRGLAVPAGVQASDGTFTDRVQVTWTPVTGGSSYQVYFAASATGTKALLSTSAGTTVDHMSAVAGSTYYYWVKSCVGALCSAYSSPDSGWRARVALPTDVQASDGTYADKVRVTWAAVSGATSYRVYYAATTTGSKILAASPTGTVFNHTAATPGITYYYWVRACAGTQCSGYSSYDTGWRTGVRLALPTPNVQASGGSYTDRVRISWSASPGAIVYQMQRATALEAEKLSLGSTGETAFDDVSAAPGVEYYYWVTACTVDGCGDLGSETHGWRALSPPETLQTIPGERGDHIALSWAPALGAAGYQVYRSETLDAAKLLIGVTSANSYEDHAVSMGATYHYWVQACTDQMCSDYSQPASSATGFVAYLPVVVR